MKLFNSHLKGISAILVLSLFCSSIGTIKANASEVTPEQVSSPCPIGLSGLDTTEPTQVLNLLPISERGTVFTENQIVYKILSTGSSNTVQVGDGKKMPYTNSTLTIPATVSHEGVVYQVISIGSSTFMDNTSLKTVIIENGVQEIQKNAFLRSGIQNIILPDTIVKIGESGFLACESLESITIPSQITTIEKSTFSSCKSLHTIIIPEGVTTIAEGAFNGCESVVNMDLPASLVDIQASAFWSMEALKHVTFGENSQLERIGEKAFNFCKDMDYLTIPKTVTTIGENAFQNCTNLEITIPQDSVLETIGKNAFSGTSTKHIFFPATITNMSGSVIQGCGKLQDITVAEGNILYSSEDGVLFNKDKTVLVKYPARKVATEYTTPLGVKTIGAYAFESVDFLTQLDISAGVTSIESNVFQNANSLQRVIMPNTVTELGRLIFYKCPKLESVHLSEALSQLPSNLFYSCPKLTSIVIPKYVTTIVKGVFSQCENLVEVVIDSPNVVSIMNNAFSDISRQATFIVRSEMIKEMLKNSGVSVDKITVNDVPVIVVDEDEFVINGILYGVVSHPSQPNGQGTVEVLSSTLSGEISIPEIVINMGKTYKVIGLAQRAFNLNLDVTSLTLPETLTYISTNGIYGCSSLTNIHLPASLQSIGVNGVAGNIELRTITIAPNSQLTTLANGALSDNGKLQSFIIPKSVTSMGTYVFGWDWELQQVTFEPGSTLTILPAGTFFKNADLEHMQLPETIRVIEESAFATCESLLDINLENITNIETNAFHGCSKLKTVTLNNEIRILEDGTFAGNKALTSVILGEQITTIGEMYAQGEDDIEGVFSDCTELTSMIFPANVKVIGKNTLKNDSKITEIHLEMLSLDGLGANAFSGLAPSVRFYVQNVEMKELLISRNVPESAIIIEGTTTTEQSVLYQLVELANGYSVDDYTVESYQTLMEAVTKAELLLANNNTDTSAIEESIENVKSAIIHLIPKTHPMVINKEQLSKVIKIALTYSTDKYIPESYLLLKTTIATAQELLTDDFVTQEEINLAMANILQAIGELKIKEVTKPEPESNGTLSTQSHSSRGKGGGSGKRSATPQVDVVKYSKLTTSTSSTSVETIIKQAIVKAEQNQASYIDITFRNQPMISHETLQIIQNTVAGSSYPKPVRIIQDTVVDKKVISRFYCPLNSVSDDLSLTVEINMIVLPTQFKPSSQTIRFGYQTQTDEIMPIALLLDLSKLDTEKLLFYSYNIYTKQYELLENMNYSIDANGYLRISAQPTGQFIVTDELMKAQ